MSHLNCKRLEHLLFRRLRTRHKKNLNLKILNFGNRQLFFFQIKNKRHKFNFILEIFKKNND